MIRIEKIYHYYGNKKVLSDLSFELERGKILCLSGPSGIGKSTALRLIAGLDSPSSGRIFIDNKCVVDEKIFVPPEEREVGMVFQDHALFPHMTALQNVAFGLWRMPKNAARSQAQSLLGQMELGEKLNAYPHELSGGQQQRVALARALAPHPKCLLLDEPFSGLDSELRHAVREFTFQQLKKHSTTAILVSHDKEDEQFADTVLQLTLPF